MMRDQTIDRGEINAGLPLGCGHGSSGRRFLKYIHLDSSYFRPAESAGILALYGRHQRLGRPLYR
jgi:hypothetical protein